MMRSLFLVGILSLAPSVVWCSESVTDEVQRVYGEAIRANNLDEVLKELESTFEDESKLEGERVHAMALSVQLQWRFGEIKDARKQAQDLAKLSPTVEHMWWNGCLQEAEGRAQRARKVFQKIVDDFADTPRAGEARLRLALLPEKASKKDEPSPLGEWAASLPAMEKNRASVVLGLVGRPEEALGLFEVEGDGRARFRQEIRAAEWGLDAKDWEGAQAHSWTAYDFGKIKRNRRYALALLVEAHRGGGTLSDLIEELGSRDELDEEARKVWIALLREMGRVDQALELATAEGESAFSVEMRRELLEMCREAGREEDLVSRYRQWMEAEPEILEWREGLTRHYLERGLANEAEALWRDAPVEHATTGQLLLGCDITSGLGLDQYALEFSELAIASGTEEGITGGLLFQVGLHERRGELPLAIDALDRLESLLTEASPARMDVAEAWERLGQLERAIVTLEGVKQALGGRLAEDLEMRLAWLYSEVDREEEGLVLWRQLWTGVESLSRRRYVEDRMMNVAARLGVLADIAVELEKKLIAGAADERDTGLLIRIYTKANDPVSASEVIDEFMGDADTAQAIKGLQEKARIYLSCTDYYHYEEIVRELVVLDPEGELDYLRQLAMSQLERGKPEEARDVLMRLKDLEGEKSGSEFEAGVLALAGLEDEAIEVYRKGLIDFPERIESYLLLGKLLKDSGKTARGVGMFQYLIETAKKDDLFTIAVDGLLNLEAPKDVVEWARRRTLARIATRDDKLYLYQLASDLAEELNNKDEMLRALEAALPAAREQRSSLLRELMDLTQQTSNGMSYRVVNGQLVPMESENPLLQQHLYYGRRLVGLGELIPPQVYLDLGKAFLDSDDVRGATKTYSLLTRLPESKQFERSVAAALEEAGYTKAALEAFERVLLGEVGDVSLLRKIAVLHEKLGDDRVASQQYLRGMRLLLARKPLVSDEQEKEEPKNWWSRERNVDDFDQYGASLYQGWMISADDEQAAQYWAEELATLKLEHAEIVAARDVAAEDEPTPLELERCPRSQARLKWLRDSAIRFQRVADADRADLFALEAYPGSKGLLQKAVKQRVARGFVGSARKLIEQATVSDEERASALLLVGGSLSGESNKGMLPAEEVAGLMLPLWVADRPGDLEAVLTRINLNQVRGEDLNAMQAMMSSQLCMAESSRTLELGRHWVRVTLANEALAWKDGEFTKIVERCRTLLDPPTFRSLLDFMVDLIDQDFSERSELLSVVLAEAKGYDPPLITGEQAGEWLKEMVETSPYGIGELLPFVTESDRGRLLQAAWPKVPAGTRSYLIFNLIEAQKGTLPESLIEVLAALLEETLKGSDNSDLSSYYVRRLFNGENDPKLVRRLADVIKKSKPDFEGLDLMRAKWLAEQELWDEVDSLYEPIFQGWLDDESVSDWSVRESRDWILSRAWKREPARLKEIYVAWEELQQRSETTALRWTVWLIQVGDLPSARATLDQGLVDFPDDEKLRDQHIALLDQEGKKTASMAARLARLEDDSENKGYLSGLVRRFKSSKHPARARAMQERRDALDDEDEETKTSVVDSDEPAPEKQIDAKIENVKTAWVEDRSSEAVHLFRRMWRTWPSEGNNRIFGMIMSFGGSGGAAPVPYAWPKDETDEVDEDKPEEAPSRGGLTGFKEVLEEEVEVDDADKPRSAYEILPTRPEGEREVRRILRSKGASELDQSQAIFDGLATVTAERDGPKIAIAAGIADLREGRSGKEAATLLLTLCERHPDAVGEELGALIDDLIRTVHPLDGSQLRRMARILARIGRTTESARLYMWCATLCTTERYYFNEQEIFPAIPREDLVAEVAEELPEGEARLDIIRSILDWSKPSTDSYYYGRDAFYVFSVETWREAVGDERFFEYAEPLVAEVGDSRRGVNRNSAKRLIELLGRAGRIEDALHFLDLALCEQSAEGTLLPDPDWSNYDDQGYFNDNDLRGWFPNDWEGWARPQAWCSAVSAALPEWVGSERLDGSRVVKLLLLCGLRQFELGDQEAADVSWDRASEINQDIGKGDSSNDFDRWGKSRNRSPENELWLADVARRTGREVQAIKIERSLFDEDRLHVERVPDFLRGLRETEGLEQTWELALTRAEFSRHEGLMELMIELATERADEDAVTHWTAEHEAAEAARTWWEERAEAEKAKREG